MQSHQIVESHLEQVPTTKVVVSTNKITLSDMIRKTNGLKRTGAIKCDCEKDEINADSLKKTKESISVLAQTILDALKKGINVTNTNGTTNIIIAIASNVNLNSDGKVLNFTSYGNGSVQVAKITDIQEFVHGI